MATIWTMGELLVEIMRPVADMPLEQIGTFVGPFPSGAPAIFIDTVARLGHGAGIIGCVGDDAFGRCVLNRLQTDGVDVRLVSVDSDETTACAFVTYSGDGSREFIFHLSHTAAVKAAAPKELPGSGCAYFHIMGCSLMSHPDFYRRILDTAGMFHQAGALISFDPNIRPELLRHCDLDETVEPVLSKCDILLPGLEELKLLTGMNSMESAVDHVFQRYPVRVIALKLGKDGCEIITRQHRFIKGVYPIVPKDATGAGDCFDAAFLCGLVEGLPIERCADMASAAAALNTAAFGPMEGDISPNTVAALQAAGKV